MLSHQRSNREQTKVITKYIAMAMVKAGLGIAIMNQLIVDSLEPGGEVRVMPLDPEQYVDIGIGVTRKDMISPAAARFIAYAKEHIEEMK